MTKNIKIGYLALIISLIAFGGKTKAFLMPAPENTLKEEIVNFVVKNKSQEQKDYKKSIDTLNLISNIFAVIALILSIISLYNQEKWIALIPLLIVIVTLFYDFFAIVFISFFLI
jgi:hypothetical protein